MISPYQFLQGQTLPAEFRVETWSVAESRGQLEAADQIFYPLSAVLQFQLAATAWRNQGRDWLIGLRIGLSPVAPNY